MTLFKEWVTFEGRKSFIWKRKYKEGGGVAPAPLLQTPPRGGRGVGQGTCLCNTGPSNKRWRSDGSRPSPARSPQEVDGWAMAGAAAGKTR